MCAAGTTRHGCIGGDRRHYVFHRREKGQYAVDGDWWQRGEPVQQRFEQISVPPP
jgi:hypothetical protein